MTLVKDNITITLRDHILTEMSAHVIAGTNPFSVAVRLNQLFDGKRSDCERLARTEMTIAAETAKAEEWKGWKVPAVEFKAAPDSCPLCLGKEGIYPIAEAPIPARDTHPRCRCALLPVTDLKGGDQPA